LSYLNVVKIDTGETIFPLKAQTEVHFGVYGETMQILEIRISTTCGLSLKTLFAV